MSQLTMEPTTKLNQSFFVIYRPLNFKLRYEFIDFLQDGQPLDNDHEHNCNRRFVSSQMDKRDINTVHSTKNIFLFGRGGASTLR